mmetsp:Transcript_228/g.621  ORF Transcript_228/g.621 Transcript_228/m.621 type:complete len:200 (+) Transcript_228:354-953(+)
MAALADQRASLSVAATSALDAEQVKSYEACLAAGAAVAITFSAAADVAPSRLALLRAGFKLEAPSPDKLVATKVAAAKGPRKLRRKQKAPPQVVPDAEDDDLVDEDALLAADGLEPPEVQEGAACSARAPCANCSCGRKEALENGTAEPPADPSACGNCGKGDAFRCATCPHLGKPAFKAADEGDGRLVLDLTDDGVFD